MTIFSVHFRFLSQWMNLRFLKQGTGFHWVYGPASCNNSPDGFSKIVGTWRIFRLASVHRGKRPTSSARRQGQGLYRCWKPRCLFFKLHRSTETWCPVFLPVSSVGSKQEIRPLQESQKLVQVLHRRYGTRWVVYTRFRVREMRVFSDWLHDLPSNAAAFERLDRRWNRYDDGRKENFR